MKKSNYSTNLTFGGILNRYGHFKHTASTTLPWLAGEVSPVIRFLSHTAALPFLKKKSLAYLLDLYLYFPDTARSMEWRSVKQWMYSSVVGFTSLPRYPRVRIG
jgi:hypothetical protein